MSARNEGRDILLEERNEHYQCEIVLSILWSDFFYEGPL